MKLMSTPLSALLGAATLTSIPPEMHGPSFATKDPRTLAPAGAEGHGPMHPASMVALADKVEMPAGLERGATLMHPASMTSVNRGLVNGAADLDAGTAYGHAKDVDLGEGTESLIDNGLTLVEDGAKAETAVDTGDQQRN